MKHILLPEAYTVRAKYRTHWSYRVTWYVLLAGLIVNGLMVFAWQKMNEYKVESEEVATRLVESESLLVTEKKETEPLIAKYKDLIVWQAYKRIPVAQILEVVEKNTGSLPIGLVSLNWDLTSAAPDGRRGKVFMKVFVSESGGARLSSDDPWIASLKRGLDIYSLNHENLVVEDAEEGDGGRYFNVGFEVFPKGDKK
jgi:hypothetical protein